MTTVPTTTIWPRIESAIPRIPSVERRIDALLDRLSLEEKVGQLIQGEIQYTTPDDVMRHGLGSVLNGGGSFPNNDRGAARKDWLDLAAAYHRAAMRTDGGRTPIPVLWATDAVHGHNNVRGATIFPHNIGLGATRNPDLVRQVARCTALEVSATGIGCAFSPSVSVVGDYRWGRTYESFAEDPQLVNRFARAMVEGLQQDAWGQPFGNGTVIATLKHFIGDGGTHLGVDRGDTRLNERDLCAVHGLPYFSGLAAGAQVVMASFNAWNGERVHGSRHLLTTVLKERIGFDGFVIGDWNGHAFVPGCSRTSCAPAINAGLDVIMVPEDWRELLANTIAQVKAGVIAASRIDDAVRRVLRVKFRAGLFDEDRHESAVVDATRRFSTPAHLTVAERAVQESLVLLKNRGNLLPLAGNLHVLVAGDAAQSLEKQMGGWSITWQGRGVTADDFPQASTVLDGIEARVRQGDGRLTVAPDGVFDERPDVAIVVFGETPYAEWYGDRDTLEFEVDVKFWHAERVLPRVRPTLDLLSSLQAQGIPVVSVFLTGRPLYVNAELNASDAFVVAWLPGSAGERVAAPLFEPAGNDEQVDFSGRLGFAWPGTLTPAGQSAAQAPPLFPFGFGLGLDDRCRLSNSLPEADADGSHRFRPLKIFTRGFVEPWKILLQSGGETRAVLPSSGSKATGRVGEIRVDARDRHIQEDAWLITWSGVDEARFLLSAGDPLNLDVFLAADAALCFEVRVDAAAAGDIRVEMVDADAQPLGFSLRERIEDPVSGAWHSVRIGLREFAELGLDLGKICHPLLLRSANESQLWISGIKIDRPDARD